jgi:hypothetical protein
MMSQEQNQEIEKGSHILKVYPDKETELENALEFMRSGLERNEVTMLITDNKSKGEIRKKISEWNVNVDTLEKNGYIFIKTTAEWYFPYEPPSAHRLNATWISMINYPSIKGKSGMRIFTDMSAFFRYGFVKELILYESTLEKKFDYPFTVLCGYQSKDFGSLTQRQQSTLKEHHYLRQDLKSIII